MYARIFPVSAPRGSTQITKNGLGKTQELACKRLEIVGQAVFKRKENTFFSAPDGTYTKTDHLLSNKPNFNKYKKIGIPQCTFSDHHSLN